jgi:hypothetical protein
MPTLYWGPWLAKIRRGGPVVWLRIVSLDHNNYLPVHLSVFKTKFFMGGRIDTLFRIN